MGFWDKVMDNPYDKDPFRKRNSGKQKSDYNPGAWRGDNQGTDPFDSHIWDYSGGLDSDGDGYVDGSVGDSGLEDL